MKHDRLDYESLEKRYDFGKPNRLNVLVHPGWDYRVGISKLPEWRSYFADVCRDDNCALLVISGYGPGNIEDRDDKSRVEFINNQRRYNREVREWLGELSQDFAGRFAIYRKGLLPVNEKHRLWLKDKLGNPPEVANREISSINLPPLVLGDRILKPGVFDFFTIDFSGMYRDTCVTWQKHAFPCTSLWF